MLRDTVLDSSSVVLSGLSRDVTIEGLAFKVRIYRLRGREKWMLVVVAPDNTYTFFDASFGSDTAALGAFQHTVQEEGVTAFLDRGDTETLH